MVEGILGGEEKTYFGFLAIFRNEITTILTPSTSEGVSGGGGGGHVFRFEDP